MRIHLVKTELEWLMIETKIVAMGHRDFNSFLRSRLLKLKKDYDANPSKFVIEVPIKKSVRPRICEEDIQCLLEISEKMGMSLTELIDYLIIAPLQQQETISDSCSPL